MLKCHLSIINHTSITQFDDITLSNHDFDRVAGANVSGSESRPDLLLHTDMNETYYSVFSQAQQQVYRVNERSLGRLHRDRANSCPDIVRQLNRDLMTFPTVIGGIQQPMRDFIRIPTTLKVIRKLKQTPYSHYK